MMDSSHRGLHVELQRGERVRIIGERSVHQIAAQCVEMRIDVDALQPSDGKFADQISGQLKGRADPERLTAGIAVHAVHVILQFVFALVGAVFHERHDAGQGFVAARGSWCRIDCSCGRAKLDEVAPLFACRPDRSVRVDRALQRQFQPIEGVPNARRAAGDGVDRRRRDIGRQVGIAGIVGCIPKRPSRSALVCLRDVDARVAAQVEVGLGLDCRACCRCTRCSCRAGRQTVRAATSPT